MCSPTLWTVIDATRTTLPLSLPYLDRSRELPLDVTLGAKTPADVLQQFVDRALQIRFLSFEGMSWAKWKAFSRCFSVSALHSLLYLRISVTTQVDSTVPDSALFPHASNLRHLLIQISGPSAPIFSHIAFPSLTTIQITLQKIYIDRRTAIPVYPMVKLGQLLDILRLSPLLEDVNITLHKLTTEPGASHHPVPLPRLRDFIITCSPTPFPLLMSIDFPPTAYILARTGLEGECPTHDLMFSFGQQLSPLISGSDELVFYFSDAPVQFALQLNRGGATRAQFEYRFANCPMPPEQTFTFLKECPLDTIQRFAIRGWKVQRDTIKDQVSGTMRNLVNVETLLLKSSPHFLSLLLPAVQGGRLLFPTLKTLTIDDKQEIPLQELIQVLRVRAEAGFPLERVVLRAWHFEEAASGLRQFVENIECGGDADFQI